MADLSEYTQEDLNMLQYFHEEKDDHTRFSHWERIKDSVNRDFPLLQKSLQNLELAQDTVDHQFRKLEVNNGS